MKYLSLYLVFYSIFCSTSCIDSDRNKCHVDVSHISSINRDSATPDKESLLPQLLKKREYVGTLDVNQTIELYNDSLSITLEYGSYDYLGYSVTNGVNPS